MTHMVNCVFLKKEAEGLPAQPFPGELGQRIYENVSKQAWQEWLKRQTILVNENRLSMIDPGAQAFLREEMQKFLFEGGGEMPAGFVPKP